MLASLIALGLAAGTAVSAQSDVPVSPALQKIISDAASDPKYDYPTSLTRDIVPKGFVSATSSPTPDRHPLTSPALPQRLLARGPLLLSPQGRRHQRRGRRLALQRHPPRRPRGVRPDRRPHPGQPLHPAHPVRPAGPEPKQQLRPGKHQERRLRHLPGPDAVPLRRPQDRRRRNLPRRRRGPRAPPRRGLPHHLRRLLRHPGPRYRRRHGQHPAQPGPGCRPARLLL